MAGENTEFKPNLDAEHELPPAEENGQPAAPSVDVSALQSELERVKAERETLLERVARLQAEFENARKRAIREQQEFRDFALADALRSLLPVLDSFDRALATAGGSDELRTGVELIHRQFNDALAKLGLEKVGATGQPFDPNVHEALGMVETNEVEDNHVAEELQSGYKLKGRLLRPAMVRVAKHG